MTQKTFDHFIDIGPRVVKNGYCKVKLKVKKKHLNNGGIVHGGVLASLCDVALAGAVFSVMKEDQWCVTIQLNVEFLDPAFLNETIYGYGKVVRRGRTLAFVEGGVVGKSKKQITRAHGIWYIKSGPSKKIKLKKAVKRME